MFISYSDANFIIWQVKGQEDQGLFAKRLDNDKDGKQYPTVRWDKFNVGNLDDFEIYGDAQRTKNSQDPYFMFLYNKKTSFYLYFQVDQNGNVVLFSKFQQFEFKIQGDVYVYGDNIYFLANNKDKGEVNLFSAELIDQDILVTQVQDLCENLQGFVVVADGGILFIQNIGGKAKITYSDKVSFTEGRISYLGSADRITFVKSGLGRYMVLMVNVQEQESSQTYYYVETRSDKNKDSKNDQILWKIFMDNEEEGVNVKAENEDKLMFTTKTSLHVILRKIKEA